MSTQMRHRRAFSLIELLLVLVILAVLTAIVAPRFTGRSEQARVTAALTEIGGITTALDAFEVDTGRYPSSDQGLSALVSEPSGVPANAWRGPYLPRVPRDPWGSDYLYRYPGQHNSRGFDLSSAGPDGQHGTDDDITNWE